MTPRARASRPSGIRPALLPWLIGPSTTVRITSGTTMLAATATAAATVISTIWPAYGRT